MYHDLQCWFFLVFRMFEKKYPDFAISAKLGIVLNQKLVWWSPKTQKQIISSSISIFSKNSKITKILISNDRGFDFAFLKVFLVFYNDVMVLSYRSVIKYRWRWRYLQSIQSKSSFSEKLKSYRVRHHKLLRNPFS